MITVERRFEVARPLSAVWAYLADFTHTNDWDPGTVETTRTDSGDLRVGSTFHNVSRFRGRRTELAYRIVRLERDEHLRFTGENRTVEATDDMSFAGDEQHTVLTYRAHFAFRRWVRFVEPLLRRSLDALADETVVQLRATLEAKL